MQFWASRKPESSEWRGFYGIQAAQETAAISDLNPSRYHTPRKGFTLSDALLAALSEFLETISWATTLYEVNVAAGLFREVLASELGTAVLSAVQGSA